MFFFPLFNNDQYVKVARGIWTKGANPLLRKTKLLYSEEIVSYQATPEITTVKEGRTQRWTPFFFLIIPQKIIYRFIYLLKRCSTVYTKMFQAFFSLKIWTLLFYVFNDQSKGCIFPVFTFSAMIIVYQHGDYSCLFSDYHFFVIIQE